MEKKELMTKFYIHIINISKIICYELNVQNLWSTIRGALLEYSFGCSSCNNLSYTRAR